MKKRRKFTFKWDKPTGRYSSFFSTSVIIKLKRKECGRIGDSPHHKIKFAIRDESFKGNFRWITLKKKSKSFDEAKEFLVEHTEQILEKYNLHFF